VRCAFVAEHREPFSVRTMCQCIEAPAKPLGHGANSGTSQLIESAKMIGSGAKRHAGSASDSAVA
jgi:hypothetical protein